MDKLLLFALGITCLTLVLLYFFIKTRFEVYDNKIDLLFNVYQKLAMDISQPSQIVKLHHDPSYTMDDTKPTTIVVSDDSESSDDETVDSDDSCSVNTDVSEHVFESDEYNKIVIIKQEDMFNQHIIEIADNLMQPLSQPVIELISDVEDIKQIEIEDTKQIEDKKNLSKMTVKELKQMISDVHGPSHLKTKQEMIHYLENN